MSENVVYTIIAAMVILVLGFMLQGCATPRQLNPADYDECTMTCSEHGGIEEMCVSYFNGRGCQCNDGLLVWKAIK